MGIFYVIFEGDALLVVKVITDTSPNFSRITHFVDSIRMEMIFLRCASVVHVSRLCNGVAHILDKALVVDALYVVSFPKIRKF